MSGIHGFDDDDETRRLLRSRPPVPALRWAAAAVGRDVRVLSARALRGGTSSAMHLLRLASSDGPAGSVVLRRYVRPDVNAEEPEIATREERALKFVARLAVPAPTALACDPTGEFAGVPALLMSYVPGRLDWSPADMHRWLHALVGMLPHIHVPAASAEMIIRSYAPYRQESYEPPAWARSPALWERAVELFHGPTLDTSPRVFVHRDYHPGNVLWRRGSISGVVDWQSASVGPASVDVGHCRMNLLRYGLAVADQFTAIWEAATGAVYHPWADVTTLVGCLDGLRERRPGNWATIESALARAVADIG